MVGWKELAMRCMATLKSCCTDIPAAESTDCTTCFEALMEQHAEHVSWLEKASGVEVEVTDLMWIREDVYELYMSDRNTMTSTKADKEKAKIQAENLDKTFHDVAMHRLSQKRYDRLSSTTLPSMSASSSSSTPGTSSSAVNSGLLRTTKKRKRRRSSNENTGEILLKRQLGDSLTEVIEILKDMRSQGPQLLDAILQK